MNLRKVRTGGIWSIYAIASDRKDPKAPGEFQCPLLEFLAECAADPTYEKSASKMDKVFDVIRNEPQGPRHRYVDSHEIGHATVEGNVHTIFQITEGSLRVAYFYDEGKLLIATHGFVKKTKKAAKLEVEAAERACKDYFQSRKQRGKGQ